MEEKYLKQVKLVVEVLQIVATENCFALKGGTAINLFYNKLPRLSVDIDLTYIGLSQYFCGCNDKTCSHSVLIKEPIKNDNSGETEKRKKDKYDYFIKINNNNLRIQGNKVKLFVFDANSTKAMLQRLKKFLKTQYTKQKLLN